MTDEQLIEQFLTLRCLAIKQAYTVAANYHPRTTARTRLHDSVVVDPSSDTAAVPASDDTGSVAAPNAPVDTDFDNLAPCPSDLGLDVDISDTVVTAEANPTTADTTTTPSSHIIQRRRFICVEGTTHANQAHPAQETVRPRPRGHRGCTKLAYTTTTKLQSGGFRVDFNFPDDERFRHNHAEVDFTDARTRSAPMPVIALDSDVKYLEQEVRFSLYRDLLSLPLHLRCFLYDILCYTGTVWSRRGWCKKSACISKPHNFASRW